MAAAAGGFTAVCAMPNTDPVTDNQAAVGFIVSQAQRAGKARVYPIGAISLGQKGQQLAEFGELVGAGAVAVSDDGKPVVVEPPDAHGARVRAHVRHSGGRPLRGADARRRRRDERGARLARASASRAFRRRPRRSWSPATSSSRELTGGHVHLCHMSHARLGGADPLGEGHGASG